MKDKIITMKELNEIKDFCESIDARSCWEKRCPIAKNCDNIEKIIIDNNLSLSYFMWDEESMQEIIEYIKIEQDVAYKKEEQI